MEFVTSYLSFYVSVSVGNIYATAYLFLNSKTNANNNIQSDYVTGYPTFGIVVFNQNGFNSYLLSYTAGITHTSIKQEDHSKTDSGSVFNPDLIIASDPVSFNSYNFLNHSPLHSKTTAFDLYSANFSSYSLVFTAGIVFETIAVFESLNLGLVFNPVFIADGNIVINSSHVGSINYSPLSILEILFGKGAYQTATDVVIKKNRIGVVNSDRPTSILAGILFNSLYAHGNMETIETTLWENIKVIEENNSFFWYATILVEEKKQIL